MFTDCFPGPPLCPLLPFTAAQAVGIYLGAHPQPPAPAPPALLQLPCQTRSCFTPTRRIPAASTWSSGSSLVFLGASSCPELIPATARPRPPPGI